MSGVSRDDRQLQLPDGVAACASATAWRGRLVSARGERLGTGVREQPGLQRSGVTGPSVSRVGAVDDVVEPPRWRWSSVAVARVASDGFGLPSTGCDRQFTVPVRGCFRSCPESREPEAAPRGPEPTWRVATDRHVLPNGFKLRLSRGGVKSCVARSSSEQVSNSGDPACHTCRYALRTELMGCAPRTPDQIPRSVEGGLFQGGSRETFVGVT